MNIDTTDECQICNNEITKEVVDGVYRLTGQWAWMCKTCHKNYGVGLGTGRGQQYERSTNGLASNDNTWMKKQS